MSSTPRHWRVFCSAAALVMVGAGVTPAAAQSQPQFEISASVDARTATRTFTETEALAVNAETETITVAHGVKTAAGFDLGGAIRIAPRFWVGVHYAMADMKTGAAVTAVVPHPLLFNAPRTVQGSAGDTARNEREVHEDLIYVLPVRTVDFKVMAGPTFFNVRQDFVSGVKVNETYPYDTATFASASTTRLSRSALGYNAALDISRRVARKIAMGALIRYSRANVQFGGGGIGPQTVKAGGVDLAAGVRVTF